MFRINEAIARACDKGGVLTKTELAAKLWPDANKRIQQVNMTNLCTRKTKRIAPEWVAIICQECGCTADFLFGLDK